MTERLKYRLLTIGAILAGGALQTPLYIPDWQQWLGFNEHWAKLVGGFGEAFIIAGVLAVAFDRALKRELVKEVVDDVSPHILGWLLPKELREYLARYMQASLVRSGWKIKYTITDWSKEHPECARLVTEAEYRMHNRSSSPIRYPCFYSVENPLQTFGTTKIEYVRGFNGIDPSQQFSFPGDAGLEVTDENDSQTFRHVVQLPVHSPDRYAYECSMKSVECLVYGAIVPFFTKSLVLDTTLTVVCPPEISVFVDFPSSDKEIEPQKFPEKTVWKFAEPLLPGQGFTIRFQRKS
ncbi:MAG: hypothetical protein ACREXR_07030 [Gammaproteobacteria bacterium]